MSATASPRRRKLSPLDAARALASPDAPIAEDDPPPKKPPQHCPWCGGRVMKRWTPQKIRSLHQRPQASVAHVCLACKVAVRVFKFPERPLLESRKAARAQAQVDHDDLAASGFDYAYQRELYRRGRCSCNPHSIAGRAPCPIHAPLPKGRRP